MERRSGRGVRPFLHGRDSVASRLSGPSAPEGLFPYLTGGDYDEGFIYIGGAFELGFNLWWVTYLLALDMANRFDVSPIAITAPTR